MDENNEFDDLEFDDDLGDVVETIIMTGDNGAEVEYLIIDEVEHKNAKYLLVVEGSKADDDEADALIFKQVEESENEFVYEELSDEEFDEVAKILSERLDEYEIDF